MMPPQGAAARSEVSATLSGIAHERFTAAEIGRLLDELAPLETELDYDSDDASLIRVTRRDWEKARRVPAELDSRLGARGRQGARRLAGGARGERLLRLPAGAPARPRRRAALGGAHGARRLALRRLPRRVRAGDEDGRGEGGLRRAPPGVDRDRARRGRARGRLLPRGRLPGRDAAGVPRRCPARLRLRGRHLPPRPDRAPVRDHLLPHGHPDDDPLQADQPARALGGDARGGPRPHVPGHGAVARALAAVRERLARPRRVAEPHLGEPRRPLARLLARPPARSCSASSRSSSRSTSTPGIAASTASRPG